MRECVTLSKENPLDDWRFLIGTWKGSAKDMYDEEGVVVSVETFSEELGERFIMGRSESTKDGKVIHTSISLMFYDVRNKKFLRKSFFSYGFVNNEIEYKRSDSELRFEMDIVPMPKSFEGTKWRSYIEKMSDTEIRMGLKSAKGEADFQTYGDTLYRKVNG